MSNRNFANVLAVGLLYGCSTAGSPTGTQNLEGFCTVENGYLQGMQGASYTDECPDLLAPAFLDGYQMGYAVYLSQLEIESMERAIQTLSDELAQLWEMLDAATDARRGDEVTQLTAREAQLTAELDELEAEVVFRKQQLQQTQHLFAANEY